MEIINFDFPPAPTIEEENELNSKFNNLTIILNDPYDNNSDLTEIFPSPPLPSPPVILSKELTKLYNSKTLLPLRIRSNKYNQNRTCQKRSRTSSTYRINNYKTKLSNESSYVNIIGNNNNNNNNNITSSINRNSDVTYATLMNVSSNIVSKVFDNTSPFGQDLSEHATYQELEHCFLKNVNFSDSNIEQLNNLSDSLINQSQLNNDQLLSISHSQNFLYQNTDDMMNDDHNKPSTKPHYENNINICPQKYENIVFLKQRNDVSCMSTSESHKKIHSSQNDTYSDKFYPPLLSTQKDHQNVPLLSSLLDPTPIPIELTKSMYVNVPSITDNINDIEAPNLPSRKSKISCFKTMVEQNSNEQQYSVPISEVNSLIDGTEEEKKEIVTLIDNLLENSMVHNTMNTLSNNEDLNIMQEVTVNGSAQQLCTVTFNRFQDQLKTSPERDDKSPETIINSIVPMNDNTCRLPLQYRRKNQNTTNRRRRMQGMRGNILRAAGKRHSKLSIRGEQSSIRQRSTVRGAFNLNNIQQSQNTTCSVINPSQSTLQPRSGQSKRQTNRIRHMKNNNYTEDNTENLERDVDHTYNEIKHPAIQNLDDPNPISSTNMNNRSLGVLGRAMQFNGALRDRVFSWYRGNGNGDEPNGLDNNSKQNTLQHTNENENQILSPLVTKKFNKCRLRPSTPSNLSCAKEQNDGDDEQFYTHDHFILRRRPNGSASTMSADLQDENESVRQPSTQLQRPYSKQKVSPVTQKRKPSPFQNVLTRSHQLLSNQRTNIALSKISSLSSKSYGNFHQYRKKARSSHLQLTLDKNDVDFIHGILNKTKDHNQAWNRVRALKEAYIRASTKTKTLPKKKKSKVIQNSITTKVKHELEKYDELPSTRTRNHTNKSCYNSEDNIDSYEFDEEEEKNWMQSHRRSVVPSTVSNIKPKLINLVTFLKRKAEINVKNIQKNFTEMKHKMQQENCHRLELQQQKRHRLQDVTYPREHHPLGQMITLGGRETEETNCENNVSTKDKHLLSRMRNHRLRQDRLRLNVKDEPTIIVRKPSNTLSQRPVTSPENMKESPRHYPKTAHSHHSSSKITDQQIRQSANKMFDPTTTHMPTNLQRHSSSIVVQNRPTKNQTIVRRASLKQSSSKEHKSTINTAAMITNKTGNEKKYRIINTNTNTNNDDIRRKRHSTKLTDMQTNRQGVSC
ncbi:unnamed protein product [Didymodactylos carnosus]|uniref:Uncharacterized protein n=1 Tax=Didymodactylos carnosus TaxID=1234261 RepID=A0A8S2H2Z9_9BILA|nr:unnamed protein product [Didymodactylos carnosus]CAF3572257.1 unnamed protein product [Didymodactylos carnosus]